MDSTSTIRLRLGALRESQGMTRKDLAEKANLRAGIVVMAEESPRGLLVGELLDLCKALNTTPATLFHGLT